MGLRPLHAFYLNDGDGDPCAGQVSAMALLATILKADSSRMLENLGLVEPIGSKDNRSS